MSNHNFFIDLHCHPTMKPFGKSFSKNRVHSNRLSDKNNIWHYDPPTLADKLLNYFPGLTKFSQSNYQALAYGNLRVICASLYPHEKGFFTNRLGSGLVSDVVTNLASGLGQDRINFIQGNQNYFEDFKNEYQFLKEAENRKVKLGNDTFFYSLAKSWDDIESAMQTDIEHHILTILTVEGCHVFNAGIDPAGNSASNRETEILENVETVKNWNPRPFFMTFAHHFYNELCGHARSFTDNLFKKLLDQEEGINTGFTDLGKKVIHKLLNNSDGKRIYIDIKHMSWTSRKEYFSMLENEFAGQEIPVIVSHGCVTGLINEKGEVTFRDKDRVFNTDDINFYDEEIIKVAQTNGIFGVQLDERRIGSPGELNWARGHLQKRKIQYYWAKLVWNQIQHIAEVLDNAGYFAWGIMALGTDYDGIINPINGYWTSEEMDDIDDYLLMHAHNYITQPNRLTLESNKKIKAEEIVSRVMQENVLAFLRRYFKGNII